MILAPLVGLATPVIAEWRQGVSRRSADPCESNFMADTPTREEIGVTPEMIAEFYARGFAIVPINPTDEMLDAAQYSAWAEDAAAVWRDMIESVLKHREG